MLTRYVRLAKLAHVNQRAIGAATGSTWQHAARL